MFAAALPMPAHNLPGGTLATGIRDALTASSFRAHVARDSLPRLPGKTSDRAPGPKRTTKPRKRRQNAPAKPRRGIAEDAFLMAAINRVEVLGCAKSKGMTPEQKQIAAAVLARAQGPLEAIKARVPMLASWRDTGVIRT